MAVGEVRVRGYKEFLRACDHAGKDTKKFVRGAYREVGELVRVEATQLFDPYDTRSAAGYRVRVRQRGVAVEQSLRKTTGKRPDYGALQMTEALLPARQRKEHQVEAAFDTAIDKVADHFENL